MIARASAPTRTSSRARAARRWLSAPILLLAAALSTEAAQQPSPVTAGDMYAAAQRREQQFRSTHPVASADRAALREFRSLVDAYRAIVWRFPNSGYSDNALWQGAHLAADAYRLFSEERDRLASISLFAALVSEYPSSGFISRARAEAASLERTAPAAAAAAIRPADSAAQIARSDSEPAASAPVSGAAAANTATGMEASLTSVMAIRRTFSPASVQITIELDSPPVYHEESLENPPRVFFDLANTRTVDALRDAILSYETDVVRQIRVGRHLNHVTRIVLDLSGVARYRAQVLRDPFRLVVECFRLPGYVDEGRTPPAARSEIGRAPQSTSEGARSTPTLPEPGPGPPFFPGLLVPLDPAPSIVASRPPAPTAVGARGKSAPVPDPGTPIPPSSNMSGGYSLARQLGLGVGRIVLDPGHGGRDPGAIAAGVKEADITLDIALRLEKLLANERGIQVVLTRRTDAYVPLEERTAIANKAGADLFLSIHCNAARDAAISGIETYSLNFASTAHAATVAARENAAATLPMSSLSEIARVIALNSKVDESRDLARQVQLSLVRRLRAQQPGARDLGVKQAPFVVLVGASMPSVLAEVAFITNRQEGRLLSAPTYRQRAAEALLEGISRYQRSLKRTPVTAQSPYDK